MKQQNISHWEKNEYFEKFLLFLQTFAEATFTYSFESYRLPALNCHYLWYDVVKTAKDIERKILMDGNFLTTSEEFEQLLSEGPFINNCITNISNQLLNLWTSIEVLITSKRDNEDRINTISNVLCSILNRNYLYSNIEQLLQDIRLYTDNDIDNIVDSIEIDEEIDSVEKFALILSLEKYKDKLPLIRQRLNEYPLSDYRIEHFYRNLLIENLHFYVDTLFNTLIEYYFLDLTNNDSIYMNISCEETLYFVL